MIYYEFPINGRGYCAVGSPRPGQWTQSVNVTELEVGRSHKLRECALAPCAHGSSPTIASVGKRATGENLCRHAEQT